MDLPPQPLKAPDSPAAPIAEWNEAFEKVENYLRAHRIDSHLHRTRLTQTILERVAAQHPLPRQDSLATLAAAEAHLLLAAWFKQALGASLTQDEDPCTQGRVALLICDGPLRWPYAFLDEKSLPEDFATALRQSLIKAGPDLEHASMTPRDIDLGLLPEVAGETLEKLEQQPVLRLTLAWGALTLLFVCLFFLTR